MDCRNWDPMRAAVVVVLSFAGLCSAQSRRQVDFLTEVQPIFTARCMPCHSGDSAQGGLKTHTREDLLKGGKSGAAIIPGNGPDSLLVQKITGQNGLRMPPSGPPLTADAIAQIRIWIDQGAKWDGQPVATEHLAAFAPRRPELPSGAAANPVDRFLDAYFAKHNIDSAKTISDNAFARRAWYDITGLPPTPEQLKEFLKDDEKEHDKDAPKVELKDKRIRLVNRLLSDRPAYAQHWISYWNDLLRNDEGVIYHGERKSITNWLRGALETNMPYNAMVWALLNPSAGK